MLRLQRSLLSITRLPQRPSQNQSPLRPITSSIRAMSAPPLTAQKCEPCTASMPAMSQDDAKQMLSTLTGKWSLSPQPKTLLSSKTTHPDALHRTYKFKDFVAAQAFAAKLGALAEEEGHHPAIMVEWGRVTVWWWSHAINGVSFADTSRRWKTTASADRHLRDTPSNSFTRTTLSWRPRQKSSYIRRKDTHLQKQRHETKFYCNPITSQRQVTPRLHKRSKSLRYFFQMCRDHPTSHGLSSSTRRSFARGSFASFPCD